MNYLLRCLQSRLAATLHGDTAAHTSGALCRACHRLACTVYTLTHADTHVCCDRSGRDGAGRGSGRGEGRESGQEGSGKERHTRNLALILGRGWSLRSTGPLGSHFPHTVQLSQHTTHRLCEARAVLAAAPPLFRLTPGTVKLGRTPSRPAPMSLPLGASTDQHHVSTQSRLLCSESAVDSVTVDPV